MRDSTRSEATKSRDEGAAITIKSQPRVKLSFFATQGVETQMKPRETKSFNGEFSFVRKRGTAALKKRKLVGDEGLEPTTSTV